MKVGKAIPNGEANHTLTPPKVNPEALFGLNSHLQLPCLVLFGVYSSSVYTYKINNYIITDHMTNYMYATYLIDTTRRKRNPSRT